MIIASSNHIEESDFGLWAYADNLIRLTQAGDGYRQRLDNSNDEELTVLISELEQMLLPLPYQRTPYTVKEINYCVKFLADKDDFYERHSHSGIR